MRIEENQYFFLNEDESIEYSKNNTVPRFIIVNNNLSHPDDNLDMMYSIIDTNYGSGGHECCKHWVYRICHGASLGDVILIAKTLNNENNSS